MKKLSLKDTEKNTILASLADVQPIVCRRPAGRSRTAVQQKSAVSQQEKCSQWSAPEFFAFGNPPISGQITHCLRHKNKKLRMTMTVEGSTRKWSNWHATKREAFDHLLENLRARKTQNGIALFRLLANILAMCPGFLLSIRYTVFSGMAKKCLIFLSFPQKRGRHTAAGTTFGTFSGEQITSIG